TWWGSDSASRAETRSARRPRPSRRRRPPPSRPRSPASAPPTRGTYSRRQQLAGEWIERRRPRAFAEQREAFDDHREHAPGAAGVLLPGRRELGVRLVEQREGAVAVALGDSTQDPFVRFLNKGDVGEVLSRMGRG